VQILLGEQHVVSVALLRLFASLEKLAASDLYKALSGPKQCAEFMIALDIYTWSWAEQQESEAAPVLPEYALLAQELRLRKWKPPELPASLLAVLKGGAASPAGDIRRGTAAAAAAPAMVNPSCEPGIFDGTISVNKLVIAATPPKLPSGGTPCLYYHVAGRCTRINLICPYVDSHRKLTAADVAVLAGYIKEHGVAGKSKA
jgi:hypothetical protein